METFKVVETFVSINGEGKKAGRLAMFIRLKGCNKLLLLRHNMGQ